MAKTVADECSLPVIHDKQCACFRWLVLKDSYLVYLRPKQQEISEVLLFENGFNVDVEANKGSGGSRRTITVSNMHKYAQRSIA